VFKFVNVFTDGFHKDIHCEYAAIDVTHIKNKTWFTCISFSPFKQNTWQMVVNNDNNNNSTTMFMVLSS